MTTTRKKTFKRQLTGLMRRLVNNIDGKITFTEFAKIMKPVDLRPYLKRIRKYTKEEKKQVAIVRKEGYVASVKQARVDLRKPLTAFKKCEVMLDRNPDRHVGLMPPQYQNQNELAEVGSISMFNSCY